MLPGAKPIFVDDARILLYGERPDKEITRTEQLFKNEWFRYEILKSLVTGSPNVCAEALMLTRKDHQAPLASIVERAQMYVRSIEKEKGGNESVDVRLKVLFLYSTPGMIQDRLNRDQSERKLTSTPVFDLKGMWGAYSQFEFPDESTYTPLYLDTTDESLEAHQSRMNEIAAFINNEPLDGEEQAQRKQEAEKYFMEMHKLVKQHTVG